MNNARKRNLAVGLLIVIGLSLGLMVVIETTWGYNPYASLLVGVTIAYCSVAILGLFIPYDPLEWENKPPQQDDSEE